MPLAPVQEVRHAVEQRHTPTRGRIVEKRKLVQVEVVLAQDAERQVPRGERVTGAERASVGEIHRQGADEHGQGSDAMPRRHHSNLRRAKATAWPGKTSHDCGLWVAACSTRTLDLAVTAQTSKGFQFVVTVQTHN